MSAPSILFQTDPLENARISGDTSFALMLEAQARGWAVSVVTPDRIVYESGEVRAHVRRVVVQDVEGAHFEVLEEGSLPLSRFDAVLIRQDPPFDTAYAANTLLLELLPASTLVLNPPRALRNVAEKLSALRFPELMAPTMVARDAAELVRFAEQFETIVLKPLNFGGGDTVTRASVADGAHVASIEAALQRYAPEPILVQAFIPTASEGDKRVMVLDGAVVGVLRRTPKAGDFRANIHVGGVPSLGVLEHKDLPVIAAVLPLLQAEGIFWAGLDILDGRLLEINVTSPTLMRELKRCGGPDVAALFMDKLAARLAAR